MDLFVKITVKSYRAHSRVNWLQEETHVSGNTSVHIIRVLMWLDKPTKKLTKGGVLRKRQTSSLIRFDHYCVRDALLKMVRGALKQNGGVLTTTGFCHGAKPWLFKLGVIDTGGRLSHRATYPLWKGFWLGDSMAVGPRSVEIAFADGLCELGAKSLQLKASIIWEGRQWPFWIIPWHLPYKWGKARKTSVRVAQ
jgi:hypothetical protein